MKVEKEVVKMQVKEGEELHAVDAKYQQMNDLKA